MLIVTIAKLCSNILSSKPVVFKLFNQNTATTFFDLAAPLFENHCYTSSSQCSASQPGCCCMLLPVFGLSDQSKAGKSKGLTREFCILGKISLYPCGLTTSLPGLTQHAPPSSRGAQDSPTFPSHFCFQQQHVGSDWEGLKEQHGLTLQLVFDLLAQEAYRAHHPHYSTLIHQSK